jgi:hypothetical protein
VDRLQLSLFSISFLVYPKLSLIIYIRKQHNGLPFWHSALKEEFALKNVLIPQYFKVIQINFTSTRIECICEFWFEKVATIF